jgi:hypothetical protein
MREPPPMSPVLRALVEADNQRPGPSEGERKRVYAALGASLGVIPVGAVVATHAATASAATATAGGASATATAVSAASTVGRLALVIKAPIVSIGMGAVLGATLTAYVVKGPVARWTASARAHHQVATAPAHAPAVAPNAAPAPETAPAALPAPGVAQAAPSEAPVPIDERPTPAARRSVAAPAREKIERVTDEVRPAAPIASAGVLAAEQALLDPARAALAHCDGASALAHLALHEHRFPNGALAQEREAMAIRALALTGDRDGARAHAQGFRARYPGSLLWPMIEATLDAPLGSRR